TPHPPRREIEKTALGATKTVPWRYVADPVQALHTLRTEGYELWAVELTTDSVPLSSITSLPGRVALVFGNEVPGIAPQVLAACDRAVDIPMHGTKHSLNVAVAFGVACYHVSTQMRQTLNTTRTPL
ncbi:MAG: TrmH family RNA methyltransferase, partial [Bacteroidota bacterium]